MPPRPTVLVADDYPENRRLFVLYLQSTYDVLEAASGEEVLAVLAERAAAGLPVHAAALDLTYAGGLDGFALIAALRADPHWAALPTVALTAHASDEDRRACLDAGFDEYLSKPVLRADLVGRLEHLLAGLPAAP